jgi:hypothetical protein
MFDDHWGRASAVIFGGGRGADARVAESAMINSKSSQALLFS